MLDAYPHARKLPRGALAGNRFAVRIRAASGDGAALAALLAPRLAQIGRSGVPNYFGPQRFGHEGANLARVSGDLDLRSLGRAERGFVLSAARSVVFNAVLAERVRADSWDRLQAGDIANLDGRGRIFAVVAGAADLPNLSDLEARAARLEIHPTGPLWGQGSPPSAAGVRALELQVAARFPDESALCIAAGMRQERRSLRLAVEALRCEPEQQAVVLSFRLTRGGFATAVLRELIEPQSAASST